MQPYEFKQKCDLRKPIQVEAIHGVAFTADVLANKFTVEVTSNGDPVSLANATVSGYAIRDDGGTVLVTGSASGNTASITLPASAYIVSGPLDIVIKITADGVTMAVGAWRGYVQRSTTDTIVDPGHVIPSISELLAKIADCEAATTAANTAASSASTAATNANTKAGLADTAASNANAAAGKINDMTAAATTLAPGSSATAVVSEVSGHKHIAFGIPKGDTGKDFHITKTFASIAAMQAYTGSDVEAYDFVMIDTGSVEDPDTGKLYCYEPATQEVWRYIGDLSGKQGIRGETGNGIASTVLNNDYTLTITYTDGTTYTTPSIRGATGPATQIISSTTTYQESSSGSTIPSGTWQNAIPSPLTQGMFLWAKTVIAYDTGDTVTQYSISRQGVDGSGSVSSVNNVPPDSSGNVALPTDSAPTQSSGNYVTSGGVWTQLDALSQRIGNVDQPASVFADIAFSIAANAWTLSDGVYTYTYPSALITATSGIDVFFDTTFRTALTGDIYVEKTTGGALFTTTGQPAGTLTGTIRIIDSVNGVVPVARGGTGRTDGVGGVMVVDMGTISSLPTTKSVTGVTADMIVESAEFGTPGVFSNLTYTTAAGSITISGTIASGGSSTVKLHLLVGHDVSGT